MTVALVLGGAACVWADALAALRLFKPDIVIATNDMIPRWPAHVDCAVTLHPDNLPGWLDGRAARGLPAPGEVWSYRAAPRVQRTTKDWRGSSGLLGIKVALIECRTTGAVVAGVPLDKTEHFVRGKPWGDAYAFFPGWADHKRDIKDRARSMSGWTRAQLGEPDADWLDRMDAMPPDPALIEMVERSMNSAQSRVTVTSR